MLKAVNTFICLVGIMFFSSAVSGAEHTKDSLETIKKNMADGKAVMIDVREKQEWDQGHLKQAGLVPLSLLKKYVPEKKLPKELTDFLPKDKIIYCHCRSGKRVLEATDLLKQLGYDIRPLKAGYSNLVENGFDPANKE